MHEPLENKTLFENASRMCENGPRQALKTTKSLQNLDAFVRFSTTFAADTPASHVNDVSPKHIMKMYGLENPKKEQDFISATYLSQRVGVLVLGQSSSSGFKSGNLS